MTGVLFVVATFLFFLIMALLFKAGSESLDQAYYLSTVGAPYNVTVVLYDCYRRVLTAAE